MFCSVRFFGTTNVCSLLLWYFGMYIQHWIWERARYWQLLMKWKDRKVEFKQFKDTMSWQPKLGMVRLRLVCRYMRRGLTMIRIWLGLVKLKNRTVVIWNTTWVWQSNKCMHISVIRCYLFSNIDTILYQLSLSSLSHSQCWRYFFGGYMNSQGHYKISEKQTTNHL